MTSATPSKLGRYEIQALLGKGSMGIVYLARDPLIGRLVALKTFRPNLAGDDEELYRFRSRFLREAQSAGILSHPNIVTVHDVVEESEEGATFIAMEYVQGTNLKEVLRYGKPLELAEIVEVTRQIAAALDYAHAHKVVHRDVKPANVLLTPEPTRQVKLTDFGIARFDTSNLTHDGQLLGTPNYMSPEQVQGREVDHRSDLFSLGVIVYESITRHKPFAGENLTVVTHRIVYDDYTPLERYVGGMPAGLKAILDRALAKDPERRYQRASAMADELVAVVSAYERQVALSETQSISDRDPAATLGEETIAAAAAAATIPGGVAVPPLAAGLPPDGAAARSAAPPGPAAAGSGSASSGYEAIGSMVAAGAAAGGQGSRSAARRSGGGGGAGVRWWRLALLGAPAALVVLVAGLLVARWLEPPAEDLAAYDSAYLLNKDYVELLRAGRRANLNGDPAAAADAFRRARALRPDDPQVERMLNVAERQQRLAQRNELVGEQVTATLERGETALAAGDAAAALSASELALGLVPQDEAARDLGRRAEAALARQRQRRAQLAERAAAAEAPPGPAVEGAAEPAAAAAALLSVRLESEGEGRLIVHADNSLIADIGYEFVERGGWFGRKKPIRGVKLIDEIQLEAGTWHLRFRLEPGRGRVETGSVTGDFEPGVDRRLVVVYTPNAGVTARLE